MCAGPDSPLRSPNVEARDPAWTPMASLPRDDAEKVEHESPPVADELSSRDIDEEVIDTNETQSSSKQMPEHGTYKVNQAHTRLGGANSSLPANMKSSTYGMNTWCKIYYIGCYCT